MALAVGGVSCLVGFVGPIIHDPSSPQGPLLGIFITGPLGFLAGAVLGLVIGLFRQGRSSTKGRSMAKDRKGPPEGRTRHHLDPAE
jgi:hypothetical protein